MRDVESPYVQRLDGLGARIGEVGGKAANLDRLVGYGFPIPEAAAVGAHAFRVFVRHADLGPFLAELSRSDLPRADRLEAEKARVDDAFLEAPMPEDLEQDLRIAVSDLLRTTPIAVRSSATAEDLASASFAGQYRSFLEVEDLEEALIAIRLCWASLWEPAVRAYRKREAIPEDDLAMAVALQTMVPAQWAGVVFTRDPLGDADTSRVEIVRGLGEALVSGAVTPDDYRVDRATLKVRGSSRTEPPHFLEDLVRISFRIERRFGSPQDIEWAHDGERLFILQTRPITIHGERLADDDGFDSVSDPSQTFTPRGVGEMLPGILPPLLWTINAPMLDNAFRRLFHDLRIPLPRTAGPLMAVGRFRGRAALNLSALREAAASMPGGSAAEVERQYLGRVFTEDEEPTPSGSWLKQTLAGIRAARVRKRIEDEVALFADSADFVMALGVHLPSLTTARLLAYRSRLRALAWRGFEAEVAASAGAAAAYRALEIALERWTNKTDAALWAQRITAGPEPEQQAGINCASELWDLYIENVHQQPSCDRLLDGPMDTAEERLRAIGADGHRFVAAVHRTMRHFGSMAVYGGRSWDEDKKVVWESIASMAICGIQGVDIALEPRFATSKENREAAFEELLTYLKRSWKWRLTRILTGQVVDMRKRFLSRLTEDATLFLSMRERSKSALLILGGEERRLILEIAKRLTASGHLRAEEDVSFLADEELTEMLSGGEPVSVEELTRRKDALALAEQGAALPETFEGRPGVEVLPPIEGDEFTGWAAGPGVSRGPVRILDNLAAGANLEPGEILVARSTDPSWTPLFMIAGGIVLEQGGPLSHAAIVAREFGLPAVLNLPGATRAFETGEAIEVDGSRGIVTRITSERQVA